MLFLLTGEVQTGKTRWLESLVVELASRGVPLAGVLAPGQWVPSTSDFADDNGFEKLGIDNVLLPGGDRITFARRDDLAREEGAFDEASQAARAELAWHISDDAILRVNEHFDALAASAASFHSGRSSAADLSSCRLGRSVGGDSHSCHSERSAEGAESKNLNVAPGGLLIVDELGRLEILRGGGLTSAVCLLQEGPTAAFPDALVVVRDYLLEDAEALLSPAWPEIARIQPMAATRNLVIETCIASESGYGEVSS